MLTNIFVKKKKLFSSTMKLVMKYAMVSFYVLLIVLIFIVNIYWPFHEIKDQGFKINISMGPGKNRKWVEIPRGHPNQ